MASYTFSCLVTVTGDEIKTENDALLDIQIMVNDYEDNNPDRADINIRVN